MTKYQGGQPLRQQLSPLNQGSGNGREKKTYSRGITDAEMNRSWKHMGGRVRQEQFLEGGSQAQRAGQEVRRAERE